MSRKLPAEYDGWEELEPEMRRLSTPELVVEIQDGSPARRLAAMSVIDLGDVAEETIRDWVRALPAHEANELAGAIPAQRAHARIEDDLRWVDLARFGYERRLLPTFLVMLTASLESLEAKDEQAATDAWHETGAWLLRVYRSLRKAKDTEAAQDISLFLFESHLSREPLFEAFRQLIEEDRVLARAVSSNPGIMLIDLAPDMQRRALEAAERAGGLPLEQSWKLLHEPSH
ncbi:MAG: hypothetical protein KC482_04890 [Dehalococcoidia bacterium]|nr:hypothetical protein [Dehalococcoidia bacterium]MCA9825846.1 hypothetical protein [Dehalococcoidia bacterium]MCA9844393.1 hypothetical protein [Dehalococcoidia bacterium]MCA9852922.1 hypothetical protein [Dehalococcoidia bacterium]